MVLPKGTEREVVILMTDMVQYSQLSSGMTPEELRDFLIDYHGSINAILEYGDCHPMEVEPSAGDGSLIIFDKRSGENREGVCTRAVNAALRLADAIALGTLTPTRMGVLLGCITEAKIGTKKAKFGTSFAQANRLEELCGYFGTHFLMDREVARYLKGYEESIVNIAKVSLTSVLHPLNIFTIYKPGIQNIPDTVDASNLKTFIEMKNSAMEYFTGNQQTGAKPNFPRVREGLLAAQKYYRLLTGQWDPASDRILEYIRETPFPASDFKAKGMKLMEKKRDSLGERLFHLSKELLKAMHPDVFHALVVDTEWEKHFMLEWFKKGEVIIEFGSVPDGIYYLDHGVTETLNEKGEHLSTMEAGSIFGEMAYFGKEKKRTATVVAKSDVVVRKISTEKFTELPVIIKIFKQIAVTRQQEISKDPSRR